MNGHRTTTSRGAVMSEFVLVLPLMVLVLALLFYFGHLLVQAQHTSVMTRYETWRQVQDAPGPRADEALNHPQLNQAFHRDEADRLHHARGDDYFPQQPYDEMIEAADELTDDAGELTDAMIHRTNGEHRFSRGRRNAFTVQFDAQADRWDRLSRGRFGNPSDAPFLRTHVRIGTNWLYTNDWRAGGPNWPDVGGGSPHHFRAARDVFFDDFDAALDAVDLSTDPEYGDEPSGPDVPGDTLAGFVRGMYLNSPDYRGPRVD